MLQWLGKYKGKLTMSHICWTIAVCIYLLPHFDDAVVGAGDQQLLRRLDQCHVCDPVLVLNVNLEGKHFHRNCVIYRKVTPLTMMNFEICVHEDKKNVSNLS
jgi:hypothetical protein